MQITSWGKYPIIEAEEITPLTSSHLKNTLQSTLSSSSSLSFQGIVRGMGRSYGDSALASRVIDISYLNHLLNFDVNTGLLACMSGVTLDELLNVFVPKGWFLPVTPGTKFVSVGGAIASDVHGKNHHVDGCFSEYVKSFRLMLSNGEIVFCSREKNSTLFYATCGGMGLTGIILDATIQLKSIKNSFISEEIFKAANLKEVLEFFEEHKHAMYSVAWIDCLSTGRKLGRSLFMLGEHAEEGGLELRNKKIFTVPIEMPQFLLNRHLVNIFNSFYYHRIRSSHIKRITHYESFFYPLDRIAHWNRLYGKKGFIQYQFVIPKDVGLEGMTAIFQRIASSKRASFLAVLKKLGKENKNYLSFPMEGYTLALDFKLDNDLLKFLDELDRMVLDQGGRLYLTKDARMSEKTFKQSYPGWEEFMDVRHACGADQKFHSLQSRRLGL